jgi:nicotinamide-nucleotide amidase
LPSYGDVKLRITTTSLNPIQAYQELEKLADQVIPLITDFVYHKGDDKNIEELVVEELIARKMTLSIAESCTGGTLAALFTAMSGASNYLQMAIVPYQIPMKSKFLNIDLRFIEEYGVVSIEVAEAMAIGVAQVSNANVGIATTGVAGPSNGGINKLVGTICVGISINGVSMSKEFTFGTQRETNIKLTNANLLRMLLEQLRLLPAR